MSFIKDLSNLFAGTNYNMGFSNIGKGAIISYLAIFLNISISFLYTPWMLRQIGVSDYGLYSLILSFISYFIMDFGLSSAIARFIARYRAEGNEQKIANMLGITTKLYLGIDFVIFLILTVCYFFITEIFKGLTFEEIEKLKVLYIIAGLFSVLSFAFKPMDGAMTAFEYFVPSKLLDMTHKVGVVVLVVIALLLEGSVFSLVFINGAVAFLTSLAKFFYWRRKSGVRINYSYYDKRGIKELFSYSGWTFIQGLGQRMRLSLVPSVLGIFSDSEEIAIFALGMTLEAMTWTLSSALNGLYMPTVSRMSNNDDHHAIHDLLVRVGRIQLFIVTLILWGFYCFGKPFILLWVGEKFVDVYFVVIFLTITNILSNTLQIATEMVFVKNLLKYTTSVSLAWSFAGIIGACLVANRFGAVGCACCSGLGIIMNQFYVQRVYRKRLNLNMCAFFTECHLSILPVLSFIGIITFFIVNYIDISSWFSLIISAGIFALIYGLISYFFLFNQYEKNLFKGILRIK